MSPAIADKETRTYKLTETERRMMVARAEGWRKWERVGQRVQTFS